MNNFNQKLTYFENKDVQEIITNVLNEVCNLVSSKFTTEQMQALILIGGYGRGEGGIVCEDDICKPHNNLDLLYIYNGFIDKHAFNTLNKEIQLISSKYGIGIDISSISKNKLYALKGLVISYDMRFGHVCILGDSNFLKEYSEFNLYNIDPADIRQLLVNRGTLLLINRLLLKKIQLTSQEKKLIIKHTIKAIIGYGDAFLYFHGKYNWSYAQKQFNMSNLTEASEELKTLYNEAILFRFKPNYAHYENIDLQRWNEQVMKTLSQTHLECESIYLETNNCTWNHYFSTVLNSGKIPKQNFKQKINSIYYAVKNFNLLRTVLSPKEIYNFSQFGARGVLSLIYPYIAYQNCPQHYSYMLKGLVNITDATRDNQLNGFLLMWGKFGDTNFINVLKSFDITLETS